MFSTRPRERNKRLLGLAAGIRLIRRYAWLVETILKTGRISLEDINREWEKETALNPDEERIPARTFHRHREGIAELFGIEIECDRFDGNTYYIANPEILSQPSFTAWIFQALALDNQLAANKDLEGKIQFEEAPGGSEFLPVILSALSVYRELHLVYRGFGEWEETETDVKPYGLKQSARRWYLLANEAGGRQLNAYALDRIEECTVTDKEFVPDGAINLRSYFDEVVGINLDDEYDCEEVTFRIYGRQRAYVESLPLHRSQKCVRREKEYSDYTVKVRPEYEFVHEILKQGFSAEVLSPAWLRDEIRWQAAEILKRYDLNITFPTID